MNDQTLSSFWRHKRSLDRPIALRDLQAELTYLARLILKDSTTQIVWHPTLAENVDDWRRPNILVLDSSPVDDIPAGEPVPDDRVDTLVGDTVYRAHLEELNRDQAYGAATRILDASTDPKVGREARVLAAVKHLKAWRAAMDSVPAVRDYVNNSRQWKRDHIAEIARRLGKACQADEIAYEDVLDLWSLFLIYDVPLPPELNSNQVLMSALINASQASFRLVARERGMRFDQLVNEIRFIASQFSIFKARDEILPPPPQLPMPGDRTLSLVIGSLVAIGEQGDNEESELGKGQESPEGTGKENEGEPPEGGPGEEKNDGASGESQTGDDSDTDDDQESDQASGSTEGESGEDAKESSDSEADSPDSEPREDVGEEESGLDNGDGDEAEESEDQSLADRITQGARSEPMVNLIDQMETINDEEAAQIRESIEFAREEIGADIESITNGAGQPIHPEVIWQKAPYDAALERQLRTEAYKQATGVTQVLSRFKRLRSRIEHGTLDGYRIDSRRLGRVTYGNNHVFKKRSIIDKLDMCLVLLLDSSSSVGDNQWSDIMHTAAAFVQALSNRDDVELMVASYSSRRDNTTINRHFDKKMNYLAASRGSKGGTPSDVALAAVRESIFKRLHVTKHDKVIIHLTDGIPGDPYETKRQVQLNRESHIDTYCILVRAASTLYYQRLHQISGNDASDQAFRDTYGDKYQKLEGYSKLLDCLTKLFEKITEVR